MRKFFYLILFVLTVAVVYFFYQKVVNDLLILKRINQAQQETIAQLETELQQKIKENEQIVDAYSKLEIKLQEMAAKLKPEKEKVQSKGKSFFRLSRQRIDAFEIYGYAWGTRVDSVKVNVIQKEPIKMTLVLSHKKNKYNIIDFWTSSSLVKVEDIKIKVVNKLSFRDNLWLMIGGGNAASVEFGYKKVGFQYLIDGMGKRIYMVKYRVL